MSELKRCPFCGSDELKNNLSGTISCKDCGAKAFFFWNTRPIEDELNAQIAELTAENERLCSLLHDINSQLEIATDLGSKRWQALNDIYLNGEKHNANWCKRKAQEGLGIR